jgi:hypothetical protein
MGTWGTAIFSDDTACDVRDDYRDLVGEGHLGTEATDILLEQWQDILNDPDAGPVFWLALAATQWKCGRLEDRVKQRALKIIADRANLAKWEANHKDMKKREGVLLKLRDQLNSPQPPEKRIPKPFRDSCDWRVGELISYRLLSGKFVLFRVIGHHSDKGGVSPFCELLDWIGETIPGEPELWLLGIKKSTMGNDPPAQFLLGRLREKELPQGRVTRLNTELEPSQEVRGHFMFLWRYLDRDLKEVFGIE